MKMKNILCWFMTIVFILPILASCKKEGDALIERELEKLEVSQELKDEARSLLSLHKAVSKTMRKLPRLKKLPKGDSLEHSKATRIHKTNRERTLSILNEQERALNLLVGKVKNLSRIGYETEGGVEIISQSETLTLFNLLSIREMAGNLANNTLLLMTKFDKEYFDQVDGNKEMKEFLLSTYIESLSILAITNRDLKSTLSHLREMKDAGLLDKDLDKTINKLVLKIGGSERTEKQQVNNFLKESITDKAQDALGKAVAEYHNSLKGKTFLYHPELRDHPMIHILVIVSNLTWGLVNTLVGLGFVITAAILAPITQAAGATIRAFGYEPLFMEMRLPRLRIADNHMQIYADVCGLGFTESKMSAGIFELDFCTWESFASDHEGGHAKQSALLGPLYFPAAILSYILVLGHGGYIEEWADAWATT